jgi:hypothetical protein
VSGRAPTEAELDPVVRIFDEYVQREFERRTRILELIEALQAEVRRLRSDDWLQRAAEEICVPDCDFGWADVVEILRKHRDGL